MNEKRLPARWADVTLKTIRQSYSNTPTYTSRSLGYIGVTMYESVVHGSNEHNSMAGQLSELYELPLPDPELTYNWKLSLNSAQASILRNLYPYASRHVVARIDSLESATYQTEIQVTKPDVVERSVLYGRAIAHAIYEWSKTDGGHEGYLNNFDFDYIVPTGNGYWTPPFFGQSASMLPLHPHWGNNRTFVAANAALPVPQIETYSKSPSSAYYNYFKEVYTKRYRLTAEEKRIAAWWADDPTQTASPPGHSYNLATLAVTAAESDIFTAAEVYAKTGVGVADAFVCCWKIKFKYHSERPFPYIKANIDNRYEQFWPEPPFPAFSSGHATQSAAAAMAMISVFGNSFTLVDNTYAKRDPDFEGIQYRTRRFNTIWETAEECAYSRFLGGIHTRMDNETGTRQGKEIGKNIVSLTWKR